MNDSFKKLIGGIIKIFEKAYSFLIFGIIFFLSIFISSAYSETALDDLTDLSIEALMDVSVYSASKFEQKVSDAPSSVSIVSSDEIKKYGYRTLADILRSIRGFYVSYDRNYAYAGARGFNRPGDYNVRILLMIDGHRINDNIYNQASIITDFPLDVDLIDRVEVVRGPGSSLYGDNASFEVINVITRDDLNGGEVSGSIASHQTYNGRLSVARKFGDGINMMVSGSIMDSKGNSSLYFKEFDNPAENNGIAEHGDIDRAHSFFTKLRYHNFTLEGIYNSRTKVVPTAFYETVFNDTGNRTLDEHAALDLKYDHTFKNMTAVLVRLYYDYYKYRGDYVYMTSDPIPQRTVNKDIAIGEAIGGEALISKQLFEKHKISAGFEIHENIKLYQRNYYESPLDNIFTDNRQSTQWAFYLQDEFRILDNLTINGGIRYDHYSTFGNTVNPRLGLLYKPFENSTVKLLYGEAFRAPSAYELFYAPESFGYKENPDLKPEKIKTCELIYEHYLGKQLKASVSGFINRIDNIITQTTDPDDGFLVFVNSDNIDTQGFEFELEGKWSEGLQGKLSYAFSETKDHENGKTLANSPAHLAKLNIIFPLSQKNVFLGMEGQYTSKRKSLEGSDIDGFFVANATLYSKNIIKGLEVSGSIYNLLDEQYSDPGIEKNRPNFIPQDGRTFRIKITYAF